MGVYLMPRKQMPPEMGVYFAPIRKKITAEMPLYAPIGRGIAPIHKCPPKCPYTSANAPMPAQMPRAMPANAPRSRAGTQMPLYTRGKPKTPLVFDLSESVSVYSPPPIIPQNAPICPAMCAGKIKCPALYAPVCPYIRA